jgi:PKD repeat protein
MELYSRTLISNLPYIKQSKEEKITMSRNRFSKSFAIIITLALTLAISSSGMQQEQFVAKGSKIFSPDPGITITTTTNQQSYLLRQQVEVEGSIKQDGSPTSDLVVVVQINNRLDAPLVFRTLQIGNPNQTWPINITSLFLTNATNYPINTVKTNTEIRAGITLYNWQSTARSVFATFTVFDANMVPLATRTWNGTIDPLSSITSKYPIEIPNWACSGKALIIGNAFSKEPMDGGIALSLEKTAYFCMSRIQQGMLQYPTLPPPPPQTTPGVYSSNITLSPDPLSGQYQVYVLGQASPTTISSASTTFSVQDSTGYPPAASFVYWPTKPYVNMTTNFDASSSSPEGFNDTITKYEWDFGDGTPKINTTSYTTTHTYQQNNTFLVTLNVTDNEGLWSTTTKPITILPEFGPKANFTWIPKTATINETITFDASNSTTGWSKTTGQFSPIATYTWNFSDGTGNTTVTTPQINHNYTQPGNYTVILTVTDKVGRYDTISANIEVLNATVKSYDINGDGVIDGGDLIIVAFAYGSYPGHPKWNPIADINHDNVVDGSDMLPVARHFGEDP